MYEHGCVARLVELKRESKVNTCVDGKTPLCVEFHWTRNEFSIPADGEVVSGGGGGGGW